MASVKAIATPMQNELRNERWATRGDVSQRRRIDLAWIANFDWRVRDRLRTGRLFIWESDDLGEGGTLQCSCSEPHETGG
ncbi:hypothetical protein RSSM_03586 [Rhodopirellula sallentina SM41]|uniref:Uncharacterized protein n=1 Tax=Rhodopirellula sallentina SM41 TaxID=1263870 RepID=M5UAV4_9BACT|nr:hypothetical protein RSSM_03586 [Rhodopirellula sallentina SM41]